MDEKYPYKASSLWDFRFQIMYTALGIKSHLISERQNSKLEDDGKMQAVF